MTKWSPATDSDLQRIRHSNPQEIIEAVRALLDRGEALDDAAELIERRIRNGDYIVSEELAKLIARTKRVSLYELAREQLFKDEWALLSLYRGRFPDERIEKRLSEILYSKAADDSEPRRRLIVEAMRDVGSIDILPVLEAILFDLLPTKGTKNAIANALFSATGPSVETMLAGRIADSRTSFLGLLDEAIVKVQTRARESDVMTFRQSAESNSKDKQNLVQNAHAEFERASRSINDDPTYSLVCLRRGAEAMGKYLYRHLDLEKGGKPARKMMLEDLLKPIRDSDAPEIFKICIQALQPFGNYAAHDQDDQFINLNARVGVALLTLYEEALLIFEQWLRQSSKDQGSCVPSSGTEGEIPHEYE